MIANANGTEMIPFMADYSSGSHDGSSGTKMGVGNHAMVPTGRVRCYGIMSHIAASGR